MKVLIFNYNNIYSTEASYLHQTLVRAGVDIHLWDNPNISAFDAIDQVDPDVFITHHMTLSEDMMKRLSGSKCKLVINVTNIPENSAESLENVLSEMNIKCPFVFYNFSKPKGFSKIKTVQIMPAADIFIPYGRGNRTIPYAILSTTPFEEEPVQVGEIYHKILMAAEVHESADANYSVGELAQLAGMYDSVLLTGDTPELVCGQAFFDMTMKCSGKCAVRITDENEKMVGEFMVNIFPDMPEEKEKVRDYMQSQIFHKNTCLNRAERLAKNLGLDEVCSNLRKMQDSFINQLQNPRA